MKVTTIVSLLALAWCLLATRSKACLTSAECKAGECCLSSARPVGRRQLHLLQEVGTCQPRGKLDAGCLVRQSQYDANKMFFECPCIDGLTCLGIGMFDIPLGEMGICVQP